MVLKNKTDIKSFLGLCSYYQRFIPGFASRASPLNDLLWAGQVFKWTDACQSAFEDMKQALTGEETMAYPQDDGQYFLDTDASATGIVCTLSQLQPCPKSGRLEERSICFASKTLTQSQRRYCTTRKEFLAVVTFAQEFRHYLLGRQFIIRTDHSALQWVMSFKEPQDQMARWLEGLLQFDFVVQHQAGKKHGNVDGPSRIPCEPDGCDCYDDQTILAELPCRRCDICRKRHQEWSSFFAKVDDVVSLSARCVQPQQERVPGWGMQLLLLC